MGRRRMYRQAICKNECVRINPERRSTSCANMTSCLFQRPRAVSIRRHSQKLSKEQNCGPAADNSTIESRDGTVRDVAGYKQPVTTG